MRAAVVVSGFALVVACSSNSRTIGADSGTGACNDNPWECPAGQVCWPKDAATFACLNGGAGQIGDACKNFVGSPTCAEGLACLSTDPKTGAGVCTPYCSTTDVAHRCPSGACQQYYLGGAGGATFYVCQPAPGDAGSDSSSGGDAGGGDSAPRDSATE